MSGILSAQQICDLAVLLQRWPSQRSGVRPIYWRSRSPDAFVHERLLEHFVVFVEQDIGVDVIFATTVEADAPKCSSSSSFLTSRKVTSSVLSSHAAKSG
jgi:hypothetical protein